MLSTYIYADLFFSHTYLHEKKLIPEARVVFSWVFFLNKRNRIHGLHNQNFPTPSITNVLNTHRKNLIVHQHHLFFQRFLGG